MLKNKFIAFAIFALFSATLYADVHAHWGYGDKNGPKNWGDLDSSFELCKNGNKQTPINIITANALKTKNNVKFSYSNTTKDIVNNGHSIQINTNSGNIITFNDVPYELNQFHFHTHSENQIDGIIYPLEAHLVHKNKDGKLLVVSVLFKEGKDNKALAKIIKDTPKSINKTSKFEGFIIDDLLPKDRGYYEFIGSLTTPPCSEDVEWIVMKNQVEISKKQIDSFKNILHSNARDVKPLNDRIIKVTE
ncbi:carbonic anhydrase [Helicobacter sp. MIT 14-3879]|uniref:carbonic anhydrase n=1 Tax=Helicobacter sp. MIT 14-3879 TaxID=2040649 RepID=UPI000E1EE462|nr:carbonic anhydrase family protein [Helicobacter sp. MIT 14-3879]RDU64008.1 hypothetical protein CQA44_05040 [Helicobacter sp. MIT 14-3879]